MGNNQYGMPFPSTYLQVVKNMRDLAEIIETLGDLSVEDFPYDSLKDLADTVKNLEDKLLNQESPTDTDGDIVNDEDGMKVIGVHINSTNVNNNTMISAYKQGVTYEVKSVDAIGLTGKLGMSEQYCMVITYQNDKRLTGEVAAKITPFQIVYATDQLLMYKRTANVEADTWNEWTTMELARMQIIETEDNLQPGADVQLEGEYWSERLD